MGTFVSLRVDARAREFVVEHHDREVKRLPIKGLGRGPLPFTAYLDRLCAEARVERIVHHSFHNQRPLPLGL